MLALKRNVEIALRLLLALLFIFSGCAKSIDCVGTSLYVASHLDALSLHAITGLSKPIAALLGAAELGLGLMLLLNIMPRLTRFAAMSMLGVFTLVTLLNITIFPLEDCGCFGDVVTLSAEATFIKNLLLFPPSVILWLVSRKMPSCGMRDVLWAMVIFISMLGVNIYTLRHLPIIDLLPYSAGTNLRAEINAEREARKNGCRTELVFHDKDGAEYRFDSTCTECWMDENLEYSGVESVAMEDVEWRYDDFALIDANGLDCSDELLSRDGASVWLCVASIEALDKSGGLERVIAQLKQRFAESDVVVLSAVYIADIPEQAEVYGVDISLLRTMIRADIGTIHMRNGVVEDKHHIRDLEL